MAAKRDNKTSKQQQSPKETSFREIVIEGERFFVGEMELKKPIPPLKR